MGGVGPGGFVEAHRGQLQLLAEGQDRGRISGGDRADRDDLALGREVAAAVVGRGFGGRAGHGGDNRGVVLVGVVAVEVAAEARDTEGVGRAVLPDAVGQRAGAAAAVLGAPDVVLRQFLAVQAVADEVGRGVEDAVVAGGLDLGEEGPHHLGAGRVGQGEDAGLVLDVVGKGQGRLVALRDLLGDDREKNAGLLPGLGHAGGIGVPVRAPGDADPLAFLHIAVELRVALRAVPAEAGAQHCVGDAGIFDGCPGHDALVRGDVDKVTDFLHLGILSFCHAVRFQQ